MKHLFNVTSVFILVGILLTACNNEKCKQENELIGSWQLISSESKVGEKIENLDLSGDEMFKIINETHFAFLRHDLNRGVDSTSNFVAGGGRVEFKDNKYIEYLDYCNFRKWEGVVVEFDSAIKGDTLILTGVEKVEELGVDQVLTEKYLKMKK